MATKESGNTRVSYEWIALSVTTIGALMAAIDASAVIIALPTILSDLQADFITVMWVLLGYMLILAAIVPVVGRLADILGRKNLYNLGFVIFTFGRSCADCRRFNTTVGISYSTAWCRASAARCSLPTVR